MSTINENSTNTATSDSLLSGFPLDERIAELSAKFSEFATQATQLKSDIVSYAQQKFTNKTAEIQQAKNDGIAALEAGANASMFTLEGLFNSTLGEIDNSSATVFASIENILKVLQPTPAPSEVVDALNGTDTPSADVNTTNATDVVANTTEEVVPTAGDTASTPAGDL